MSKTKQMGKGKGKGGEGKGKKGAAAPEDTHRCFHCDSEGARMCCAQCNRAWYCGRPCQKRHWKRHKKACVASIAAEARRAARMREATAARGGEGFDKETCVICVGPVVAPVELPCGHAYCGTCLAELRAKQVAQACPLCRSVLPPGLDGLFELAFRAQKRIGGMATRGEAFADPLLLATVQEEIDEVLAMLTEAAAQGHSKAARLLPLVVKQERDNRKLGKARRELVQVRLMNLGLSLLSNGLDMNGATCTDGVDAEAAIRAATVSNPELADMGGLLHFNLGVLLETLRKDIDGVEAAYRAAIAADPRITAAHYRLGRLLILHKCNLRRGLRHLYTAGGTTLALKFIKF